jgi:hypothetical protein
MSEVKIGVVGYSGQRFDEVLAKQYLVDAYTRVDQHYAGQSKAIVSGLTDVGIPALAYREATSRGWRTVGIACGKAVEYSCFPVDEKIIVGDNWGDESPTFISSIDALIRIGGGKQSMAETAAIKDLGKLVIEYDLPALPKI